MLLHRKTCLSSSTLLLLSAPRMALAVLECLGKAVVDAAEPSVTPFDVCVVTAPLRVVAV